MKAKTGFEAAIDRAEHLLTLYDLLCDQRQRSARSSWSKRFKNFMGWPLGQRISRVDGEGTMLILRESTGITRAHFGHDYLSEVLRSAVVAAVSATDRYFHDVVVEHSWKLLRRAEKDIPKRLRNLSISALDARKATDKLRQNSNARPGTLIKKAIQRELHRSYIFQGPHQITNAVKMLGLNDFWGNVAREMPGHPQAGAVQQQLNEIVQRRHQIVHEADLVQKSRGSRINLRDIDAQMARDWVNWIRDFIDATQRVVDAQL